MRKYSVRFLGAAVADLLCVASVRSSRDIALREDARDRFGLAFDHPQERQRRRVFTVRVAFFPASDGIEANTEALEEFHQVTGGFRQPDLIAHTAIQLAGVVLLC
jgi:hypothetical protein